MSNFKREEFACKCCGELYNNTSKFTELILVLEDVRAYFGGPVIITSGHRCEKHNKAVKGSPRSQHVYGYAADFIVRGVNPALVNEYLLKKYPDKYGIASAKNFTHLDVRDKKARWVY